MWKKIYQAMAENYDRSLHPLQYQSLPMFLSSQLLLSFLLATDKKKIHTNEKFQQKEKYWRRAWGRGGSMMGESHTMYYLVFPELGS